MEWGKQKKQINTHLCDIFCSTLLGATFMMTYKHKQRKNVQAQIFSVQKSKQRRTVSSHASGGMQDIIRTKVFEGKGGEGETDVVGC